MNKFFNKLVSTFFVILFLSVSAQEVKDQKYVIHEEVAKVSMLGEYERTSAEWVKMMIDGNLDIPAIHVSQSDDFHYYYLIAIDNYGDIDNIHSKFGSVVEKVGKERWQKLYKENEVSIESHKEYVVRWSADLSYIPKEPRIKTDEAAFIHWAYFYYSLDKRKEVMDVIREWKKLYEDKNISSGWNIWIPEMGLDNNLVILTEVAKDGIDYHNTLKEVSERIKEEEQKLWAKMSPHLTKIVQKYGALRPDLSYIKK